MTRSDLLLLLDFDGTVAVGSGPVHAYARAAAGSLPPVAAAAFRDEAAAAIESAEAPTAGTEGDTLPLDGYDLVRLVAERHGVGPLALSAAYLASRHALGTADAPVAAPAGLAAVLAELRTEATVVLATNAPAIRLSPTLAGLGLGGLFDRVLTDVGKPGGLGAALDALGAAPHGPVQVLSVGDVWANDLAPVAARGHATALVSRRPPPEARPTWTVPDLPALYPALRSWVRSGGRTDPHPAVPSTPVRVPARATSEG